QQAEVVAGGLESGAERGQRRGLGRTGVLADGRGRGGELGAHVGGEDAALGEGGGASRQRGATGAAELVVGGDVDVHRVHEADRRQREQVVEVADAVVQGVGDVTQSGDAALDPATVALGELGDVCQGA